MSRLIALTRNLSAIVDSDLFAKLDAFLWYAARGSYGKVYAVRGRRVSEGGTGERVYMHRIVAGASTGQSVDHINGNTLDNRRGNLRCCTHAQNQWNRGKARHNTSGFKGVFYDARGRRHWAAKIRAYGKSLYLGNFDTAKEAAAAYEVAAKKYHGAFANTGGVADGTK